MWTIHCRYRDFTVHRIDPPWSWEWSTLKQDAQVRCCSLWWASSPPASRKSAQKQVGQTMVQLAQVRQRAATVSQRGCSRLRTRTSSMPSAGRVLLIPAAAADQTAAAASRSVGTASWAERRATQRGPAVRTDLDQEAGTAAVEQLGQAEVVA